MFEDEIASIPTRPPREGLLPGMRFSAAIPLTTPILIIIFVAILSLTPILMMMNDPKMRLELGPARTVEARVLTVRDVSGCNAGAHALTYSFSTPTQEFRGTKVVCGRSAYYSVTPGDKVPVRYLSRDPALNTIADNDSQKLPLMMASLIFPLFFLIVFSFGYLPLIRELVRARHLYRTGIVAPATVVYVKKRSAFMNWSNRQSSPVSDVHVVYQTPSGGWTETVVLCTNDWLANQLTPKSVVHLLLPDSDSRRGGVLLEAFVR
jgi:hypothetical protein